VSSVIDHPEPLALGTSSAERRVSIRETFERRLAAAGFDHTESTTIYARSNNRAQYDLMVASRQPLAVKFFREAMGISNEGQYALQMPGA
jgi:hypothetical protein